MPADAEQDLLFQAHFEIAAVELIGDIAIVRAIDVQIGIEQEKVHPADANPPDSHRNDTSVVADFEGHWTPAGPQFEA